MFQRTLVAPRENFFLFGPRGTGKSTWLKSVYKPDFYIDLLRSENYLEFSQTPSLLRARSGIPRTPLENYMIIILIP